MAVLERPDGVEIHWEGRGDGPLVLLSSYWSTHPSSFEGLRAELAPDHCVRRICRALPEAHVERVDDGLISRPDQVAGVVRRITATVRAGRPT